MKIINTILLIFFFANFIFGCKSYNVKPTIGALERFAVAKKMFKNKDYMEAKTQFKIVTLNNPGAVFVDEAQFYLGECHFNLKEYVLAADEYGRLVRLYPRSEWLDDAQFKVALCDYKLSPKPSLDQTYTSKAVDNFQRFLEDFPESDLVPQADKLLKICRTKLAEKEYEAGELYWKMHDYYGAQIYFNSVLNNFYDTEFVEDATYWKAESLYKLSRNRESRETFEELLRKFPSSEYKLKIKERLEKIDDILSKEDVSGLSPLLENSKN